MKYNWIGLSSVCMEKIKQTLDEKADPNTLIDAKNTTPLITAFKFCKVDLQLIQLLLEKKADPNLFFEEQKEMNKHRNTPLHSPLVENPLSLALFCIDFKRFAIVKALLDHDVKVHWKSSKGFMTALNPFFMSLASSLSVRTNENLSILIMLLKKGAGSLPNLFNEYNSFIRMTWTVAYKYSYLAVLGFYFLQKIQELRLKALSDILGNIFPTVLAQIIYNYSEKHPSESFEKAIIRLLVCIKTNCLLDEHPTVDDEKPKGLPYPTYPLSLAAYTDFSALKNLIEAKADVTFEDENSGLTPLDYAIKRNPDIERDDVGDRRDPKPNNRFERVKIITDALKDCYRQTLLGEAQRVTELLKANSSSTSSQLSTSPS